MGENLKETTFSFAIRNKKTGKLAPIGDIKPSSEMYLYRDSDYPDIDVDFSHSISGSITLDTKYINKKFEYEVLGIKNSYYKYLKRVKNRKKLHMKRGK